jgi:DNA polymerase III epsilon subunit-like protein
MNFIEFLLEKKWWGMDINDFLSHLESLSDRHFVFIDTETTGLKNNEYEVQLTQVSALVTDYDFNENKFNEIDFFNEKIKLTDKTKHLKKINKTISKVLSFNHYGAKNVKYTEESEILANFYNFLETHKPSVWVIQNAEFDMFFLNTRQKTFNFKEVIIDTKDVAQMFFLPLIQTLALEDEKYKKMVDFIGISSRDNGLISSSLSKIGPALGINMSGYHDSLTDCRLTINMFENMINILKEYKDVNIRKYQEERIKSKRI